VNEIMTEDTSRQRATMNSTISQLHKGGGMNKTSDQRPVIYLNSVYQLRNNVVNERLKKKSSQLTSKNQGKMTSRQRATMNSTISQLRKGGCMNKTSDQRPVIFLNSVYQVRTNVMNDRLKKKSSQLTS